MVNPCAYGAPLAQGGNALEACAERKEKFEA